MQSKSATGPLERFKREPTEGNLNAHHIARAKTRSYIRHSKKTSWRNYVSKMNSETLIKSIWNRIRKSKGKESSNTVNNVSVTSHCDIANALADNFSHNSSSSFSTDANTSVSNKDEKQNLNLSSENVDVYTRPFSVDELQDQMKYIINF